MPDPQPHAADAPRTDAPDVADPRSAVSRFPIVGIGASAGGLDALAELLEAVPTAPGVAFVIVQHLPPDRESLLVEILRKRTTLPVSEIEDGTAVEVDHVYIIRPGSTLTLRAGSLRLGESLAKRGHGRPVDDFLRSLADEQRERAVCVILSGMGSNGTAGAQAIKAAGGLCIAQDPKSAKFPSMPRHLIEQGLADFVLRPSSMWALLSRYVAHPYAWGAGTSDEQEDDRVELAEVLAHVRARTHQDFSRYKKQTILRRIQRRMGVHQLPRLSDYARFLRAEPDEALALADDLLIHVTGFFRDPAAWESLRTNVIAPLVAERENGGEIRCWVTACSTGEEAYSLALLLTEELERAGKEIAVKVFGTDMALGALARARAGVYPGGIESELSPERLARHFVRANGMYRVRKELRDMVVFAPQNVLQDPPFSRLDICTCRNLLIYIERDMQDQVLGIFHFALKEGGALFLGNSEAPASGALFPAIDKRWRIFRRAAGEPRATTFPTPVVEPTSPGAAKEERALTSLLARFEPHSVTVERDGRIVFHFGETDRGVAEPPPELLQLVRGGIRGALLAALQRSARGGLEPDMPDGCLGAPEGSGDSAAAARDAADPAIDRARTSDMNLVENLQSSNEDLKVANEEASSINEELQSTNEELETSKEEMLSLNEELTTVNSQLQIKIEEHEAIANDLSSLLSSTDIAVVFLDTQLRIRRYTPMTRDLLELIPADIGRPLADLARKFHDPDLTADMGRVLEKLVPAERDVTSDSGRSYMRRALPYLTSENRVAGIVVTFIDITTLRKNAEALREREELLRLIVEGARDFAMLTLDPEGRITTWNIGAERMLGLTEAEAIGKSGALLCHVDDQADAAQQEIETARRTGRAEGDRFRLRKDGTRFWCSGVTTAIRRGDELRGFVQILRDETLRKRAEDVLIESARSAEDANRVKDEFIVMLGHELTTPLAAIVIWAKMMRELPVTPEGIAAGIDAIVRSAEAQSQLIEDLLDTSRITTGKLRLELRPMLLAPIVTASVMTIGPVATARGVTLETRFDQGAGAVMIDPDRLQQIMWNLLSNAVKFTPAGGHVIIRLRAAGSRVELSVEDSGRGIEAALLSHVFDPFRQGAPLLTRGGLGLGLSICRALVELHGGTIEARSRGEGKGSTFVVELPTTERPPEAAASSPARAAPAHLGGIHILVVEDDRETREALAAVFLREGARVTAVASSKAAFAVFEIDRPELVVSDIGLPDEDGLSFLRRVRERERSTGAKRVRAVALTSFSRERDQSQALAAGFDQHLSKPADPSQILDVARGLLADRG